MAAHDDVLYLQYFDRVLQDREAIHIRVNNQVGHVAVNEQLPRKKAIILIIIKNIFPYGNNILIILDMPYNYSRSGILLLTW